MSRGRKKNLDDHTPEEAIAYFLGWAKLAGFDRVRPVNALRRNPAPENVLAVIEWAEQRECFNVAAHLRQRALSLGSPHETEFKVR